jgi:hypothetical protein
LSAIEHGGKNGGPIAFERTERIIVELAGDANSDGAGIPTDMAAW